VAQAVEQLPSKHKKFNPSTEKRKSGPGFLIYKMEIIIPVVITTLGSINKNSYVYQHL
jgi:hypothetical protein